MKINVSKILKLLMELHGLNPSALARETGISQPVIFRLLSGETDNPKIATLLPLANYFDISINQLIGERPISTKQAKGSEEQKANMIPIVPWNKITDWGNLKNSPFIKKATEKLVVDVKHTTNIYAVQMADNSMHPIFSKGTMLLIDPSKKPKNNSYAIIKLADNDEAVFRQVVIDDNYHYLKPLNPNTDKYKITLKKEGDFYCGVLIQAKTNYS